MKTIFNGVLLLIGIATISIPVAVQMITPKVTSALLVDVSKSNQVNADLIAKLCEHQLDLLIDGDTMIDVQFADTTYVNKHQKYGGEQLLELQKACDRHTLPVEGMGTKSGTNILEALSVLQTELQQSSHQKAIITIVFNAFEPVNPQSFVLDKFLAQLSEEVKKISSQGHTFIFIGANTYWQKNLKQAFANIERVRVCAYENGEQCLEAEYLALRDGN